MAAGVPEPAAATASWLPKPCTCCSCAAPWGLPWPPTAGAAEKGGEAGSSNPEPAVVLGIADGEPELPAAVWLVGLGAERLLFAGGADLTPALLLPPLLPPLLPLLPPLLPLLPPSPAP